MDSLGAEIYQQRALFSDVLRERREMKFEQQVAVEKPASAYPRPASIQADVVTPMLQALITGALIAALAVFVIGQLVPQFDEVFESWVGMALAIAAGVWCLFLADIRRILYRIENSIGLDLDHDGMVGKPVERLVFVNAPKGKDEQATMVRQAEQSEFQAFLKLLPIQGTSGEAWFKDIGRQKYYEYRDFLIDHGLARWKSVKADGVPNMAKGWELTTPVDLIVNSLE